MEQLIHVTATYSNAVLMLVLTNVSDFAKRLDLPIPQPVTISQVQTFKPHPFKNCLGGVLTLTNGDRFWQSGRGYIDTFYGYNNANMPPPNLEWGEETQQWLAGLFGKVNMTTNEVITFARDALVKLGYDPKILHADGPPGRFEGPWVQGSNCVPFCNVEWRDQFNNSITIDVNAEKKQIVRFSLNTTNFSRPDPKLEVEPELESDYRKRTGAKMFTRTNAPPHWFPNRPNSPAPTNPLSGGQQKE